MERELRYVQRFQVPLNINHKVLSETCKQKDITYDITKTTRIFDFYAKSEEDMRWLEVNLILKPIKTQTNETIGNSSKKSRQGFGRDKSRKI